MSFHGGLLGVMLAMTFAARKHGIDWLRLMDFVAPLVPPGIAAGRLGNFINGELPGRVTDVPWGMVFRGAGDAPRHPSQLYQFALEGLVLFVLLWWFSSKPRPRGQVSAMFLLGYGGLRFLTEFVREPDAFIGFLALGLTMGQWLCLAMIAGGIALLRLESTLDPVLGAVLPVFGLVASGYLAGRFGLVTQASSAALNQFVYAFALPAMLFIAVYRGSLEEILSGYFLLAVILATLGTARGRFCRFALLAGASPAESTMRALNASFANTGYLGIPLVTVAYGERAALPAALATVATNIVSFALAIVCLELFVNPQPRRRAARAVRRGAQPADLADRASRSCWWRSK